MKRLIDLNSLRRHPKAGQPIMESVELRGEVLSPAAAKSRFSDSRVHDGSLDDNLPWFVETVTREGNELLTKVEIHTSQKPYSQFRERVFEIQYRAGFPSVLATYPEFEFQFMPISVRCSHCGESFLDDRLDIDCDEDGLVAACPSCSGALRGFEPLEETIEQALERARHQNLPIGDLAFNEMPFQS